MQRVIIAPSILAADFSHLAEEVRRVEQAGADRIHCDIMDGHFVDNISFGPALVKAVRKQTRLPLEANLMAESTPRQPRFQFRMAQTFSSPARPYSTRRITPKRSAR